MLGVVNLDKPVGPTSHDMVGLVRRVTGTRRIGHAGTLDPLASGVLPVLVGAATRFSEELTGGLKAYDAVVRLGQRSVTDDAEGPITPGGAPLPDVGAIADALDRFVGTFSQLPPALSARKKSGRRAYRAARAGQALDLPPRLVTVERLDLLDISAGDGWLDVHVDLRCASGTYVRSIARDLGELLGCGGHLHALRRTEAAGLRVDDAVDPVTLKSLAAEGRLGEVLLPVGELLPLPRLMLGAQEAWRFVHGSHAQVPPGVGDGPHAVFADGELLGTGRMRGGVLCPEKVIATEAAAP